MSETNVTPPPPPPLIGGRLAGNMDNDIAVRHERPADVAAVRRVNELAFARAAEADLVDPLRGVDRVVSMVAVSRAGDVVGHVMLTPAAIRAGDREVVGAPLREKRRMTARRPRGYHGRAETGRGFQLASE